MRADRLNMIEQYIIKNKTVPLDELCKVFNVSLNTIRRDLGELVNRETVQKIYGGVAAIEKAGLVPSLIRNTLNIDAKAAIGELAAKLINDNDFIFIDSGSTTPNILRHIAEKKNITIISHSLRVLSEASKYRSFNLVSVGGVYNGDTDSFVGASAIEAINSITIKIAIMAATGISIENGMSNTTYYEAEIKRTVVKRSNRIILLADQSKFDHDALLPFCRLEDLMAVVTDRRPSERYVRFFEAQDVQLLFVER